MPGRKNGNDAGQLMIDWSAPPPAPVRSESARLADAETASGSHLPPLKLPWDFRKTFPNPTQEAIDAGVIDEADTTPDSLRAIHAEHEREASAALRMLDCLQNARRRGVDLKTGRRPKSPEKQDALHRQLSERIEETERWWTNLMSVYADSFGSEAADAFGQAIKARHVGVTVVSRVRELSSLQHIYCIGEPAPPLPGEYRPGPPEPLNPVPEPLNPVPEPKQWATEVRPTPIQPPKPADAPRIARRVSATFPVPKPLPEAVTAGRFGQDKHGPIRPSAEEVREITDTHAHQLIDLLIDQRNYRPGSEGRTWHEQEIARKLDEYAEDFGQHAADRLNAYCQRQVQLQVADRSPRSRGR